MSFDTLGLTPDLVRAVADQGYTLPTPIQERAIPVVLAGRDLLAGAQTGTGKTAAFVLPMLQRLHASRSQGPRRVRALVVTPTRELCLQVEDSVRTYGAQRPIRSVAIYGGVGMDRQVRDLRGGAEIVVATPGRLLDHVGQRTVSLGQVEILVLDEADRMLDMGFIHDIRRILALLPTDRQSLLFSATFTPHIRQLAGQFLRDPESIDVAPRNTTPAPIRQVVHPVDRERKRELLSHLVRTRRIEQALVFTRTKHGANRLAEQLGRDGIQAAAIHGNKSQSQRVRALAEFKRGGAQVLVATDIAARGLDIEALPHVVNFELPMVPEDYVHRIGRTGRAGMEGTAISLVCIDERPLLREIEALLRRPIGHEVVGGFEPDASIGPEPIRLRSAGYRAPTAPAHRGGGPPPRPHPTNGVGIGAGPLVGRDRGRDGRRPDGAIGRRPAGPVERRPRAGFGAWDGSRGRPGGQQRPMEATSMPGERLSGRAAVGDGRPG